LLLRVEVVAVWFVCQVGENESMEEKSESVTTTSAEWIRSKALDVERNSSMRCRLSFYLYQRPTRLLTPALSDCLGCQSVDVQLGLLGAHHEPG
jgi:hypothetical protein